MATKPTVVPRFARTTGGTDATNIATPTTGESDTGFTNGQAVVSSSKTNWLFNWIYKWILYLQDAAFVATSGSFLPGVSGTGDTGQPGGSFTGGSGGVGVLATGSSTHSALALTGQSAPSGAGVGELYISSADGSLNLSLGSSVFSVLCKWLYFSGAPGSAASTAYFLAASAASTATLTSGALGSTQYATHAVKIISFGIRTSTTIVGGSVTVQVFVNGSASGTALVLAAGTTAGWHAGPFINSPISPGDVVELRVTNGSGVTAGVGQCSGTIQIV